MLRRPQTRVLCKSGESLVVRRGHHHRQVDARAIVVERLCEYMQYKSTYETVAPKEDMPDFTERIPPEIVLEL